MIILHAINCINVVNKCRLIWFKDYNSVMNNYSILLEPILEPLVNKTSVEHLLFVSVNVINSNKTN